MDMPSFLGCFDACDGLFVLGWALDPRRPGVPVVLDVAVDGMPAVRTVADRFRPDIAEAGFGDGRCGFLALLSMALCDGQPHRITVLNAETGAALPGGPRTLMLPPSFVQAVRAPLAERAELKHRLEMNEQALLAAGRREGDVGCSALDPVLGAVYARTLAAWPAIGDGDEP